VTTNPPQSNPAGTLLTELSIGDIPVVYRNFANTVGEKHWKHRVSQIEATIKGNPFLGDHLRQENSIAVGLEACGKLLAQHDKFPDDLDANRALYPAISFAAQVLSMMRNTTAIEADRLRRRVVGALKMPDTMRAYRLELRTATHLLRQGHVIEWPEMTGAGTFDLLIVDMGKDGLEVECKSISPDKGRRVHRHELLVFQHLLFESTEDIWSVLRTGLSVMVTVPAKFPKHRPQVEALAADVRKQINMAQSATLSDGTTIQIHEFDVGLLRGVQNDPQRASRVIAKVTGTSNRAAMIVGAPDGEGALSVLVQSAKDDEYLTATFETLSAASKDQLTKTRAGILVAGFDGMTAHGLLSAAAQDADPNQPPTPLALHASAFLSAIHRDWVVGVGFLSDTEVFAPEEPGLVESAGAAYFFPKMTTAFWDDNLRGIFPRAIRR
jgi:hypothetical protein